MNVDTTRRRLPRLTRDSTLLLAGLAGFFHELIVSGIERPYILGACVTMMGLPIFTNRDEQKR